MAVQDGSRSVGLTKRRSVGEWRGLVRAWKQSGVLAAEFARPRGLSPSTLRWWSSELKRRDGLATCTPGALRFVELTPQPSPVVATVSAGIAQASQVSGVEVVLSGRRVVRVSPGFDVATLQRVVVSLEGRLC